MSERRPHVLYFTPWYPCRYDAMMGLFVRKHAAAAARFCEVCVLYLHADARISHPEVEEQQTQGVREVYVYYPDHGPLRRLLKPLRYLRAFRLGYSRVLSTFGRPDLTHTNILTRSGLLSYWLKLTQHIPYVITEHWSRYLPQSFNYHGHIRHLFTRLVVRQAHAVLTVTDMLGQQMQQLGLHNPRYLKIDNVVDDFFYLPVQSEPREFKQIVHISCFDERAKNTCGILRATARLAERRSDFRLVIVGTGLDYQQVADCAAGLGLYADRVLFTGEQTPKQVSRWLHESDFLLLFSNYETYGIPIAESLACGKPFVSTPVGLVPELADETNSIVVPVGDEGALVNALDQMLDRCADFHPELVSASAERFRYDTVGRQLHQIYQECLNNR